MELSYETIQTLFERYYDQHVYETAGEYGEPGYSTRHDATTPLVVLGDYWCRCDKFGVDGNGRNELHSIDQHHPRLFAQLASQGVELEWHDEWMVDRHSDKAYRTQGDSYHWQPSVIYTDDGDPLTPDSDDEDVIEYVVNDPSRCVTEPFGGGAMLVRNGFERVNGGFENGWHPGQDDDPRAITDVIRRLYGDDVEIAFAIDENSQFYTRFSAYVRRED